MIEEFEEELKIKKESKQLNRKMKKTQLNKAGKKILKKASN